MCTSNHVSVEIKKKSVGKVRCEVFIQISHEECYDLSVNIRTIKYQLTAKYNS